jgi:hypothetical protein
MATTNVTIRHRPNRIGFLVRPSELKDVERAAEICTLLWGGIRNPIIPVATADDANADDLLKAFQLDVLCPVAETNPWLECGEIGKAALEKIARCIDALAKRAVASR